MADLYDESGKIGSAGSQSFSLSSAGVATISAAVSDGNGASVQVGSSVDLGKELLALAVKSGSAEAQQIVKGLISILPLLASVLVPAPAVAPAAPVAP